MHCVCARAECLRLAQLNLSSAANPHCAPTAPPIKQAPLLNGIETEDLEENTLSFTPDHADGDGPSTTGEADIGATQLRDIDLQATGRTFNVNVFEPRAAAPNPNPSLAALQAVDGGGLGGGLTPLAAAGSAAGATDLSTAASVDYSGMTPLERLLWQNGLEQYYSSLEEEEIDLER